MPEIVDWLIDYRVLTVIRHSMAPQLLFEVLARTRPTLFIVIPDIYDEVGEQLKKFGSGLDTECLGGGRIDHDAAKKNIKVYGYSQGFGKADHRVSVGLLKKKYPDYEITWSDEGY
ncbi:14 kDa phosphohistidine phosphatase-like [Orussus abietinus]|uniref:14 kDa phosphohistidine phosphatase-like n=1 Tax=Orussus abietinus TaxID=222816 RepID=UPI0006253DD1|nr:14 kDa phosphohistidine phosphatase-like [Orussus abietinus]